MSALAAILVAALAAASAALLTQVAWELRMRLLAGARAAGRQLPAGQGLVQGLRSALDDAREALALRLSALLPQGARLAWTAWLERAERDPGAVGALALDAGLLGLAGLLLALGLGLGSWSLAAGLLGLGLPFIRLRDLALRREAALRKGLPDALDLLTACVEAGLGFDQALARVAERLRAGPLKRELERTVKAMRLGAPRKDALKELDRRCGMEELGQLVAALVQADKRGVPLGPPLRAQSRQLRVLRSLRARKLAAEAPLKMLLPLMVFILPVVFIVLFGPILLSFSAAGF